MSGDFSNCKFRVHIEVMNQKNISKKMKTRLSFSEQSSFVIGRSIDHADIIINDPNASRRHMAMQLIGNEIHVHDLSTKNGTFVNGHNVDKIIVKKDDSITIGDHIIIIKRIERILNVADVTSFISKATLEEATGFGEIVRSIA